MKVTLNTNQINYNSFRSVKSPINLNINRKETNRTANQTLSFGREYRDVKNGIMLKLRKIAFSKFLNRKSKVTKGDYEYIKKYHPYIIDMADKYSCEQYMGCATAQDLAKIAIKTDKYLKENFDNYRIISIGTSPAPLTQQLSNMGHEVIFLPVSGLREFDEKNNYLDNLEKYKELKVMLDYLKNKNINDGKLNIILDYTNSGKTLDAITSLIKNYYNLEDDKIQKLPISTLLDDAFSNPTGIEILMKIAYIGDMGFNNIAEVSPVPHFPVLPEAILDYKCYDDSIEIKNMPKEEIYKRFDEFSKPLARAFALSVMNEIDKIKSDVH